MHPRDHYPAAAVSAAAIPDQPPPRLSRADSDAIYAAGLLGELYRVAERDPNPERQRRARLVLDWDRLSPEQRAARLLPSAIVTDPRRRVSDARASLEN